MRLARSTGLGRALFVILVAVAVSVTTGSALGACMVSASSINFGSYATLKSGTITTVGTVAYTCTGPVPAGIKILLGPGHAGTVARRVMVAGGSKLRYILSLDPYGRVPWGDGSAGTEVYFQRNPPRNKPVTIQVYGHILPDQPVAPNQLYRDDVSVLAFY